MDDFRSMKIQEGSQKKADPSSAPSWFSAMIDDMAAKEQKADQDNPDRLDLGLEEFKK